MENLNAFAAFGGGEEERARIEAVVAQWGEDFRALAANPRVRFEGAEIVVLLWVPIKVSGAETAELRMREPSMDELQKTDGVRGEIAMAKRMVTSICAITDREAGQIRMRDINTISKVIQAFSEAAPATGATR